MSLSTSIWQERGRGELVVEESVIMMRHLSFAVEQNERKWGGGGVFSPKKWPTAHSSSYGIVYEYFTYFAHEVCVWLITNTNSAAALYII